MATLPNPAWQSFIDAVPWFNEKGTTVSVGITSDWERDNRASPDFFRLFPRLHELLQTSSRTPVEVGNERYELLTWGTGPDRPGWLCRLPPNPTGNVFEHHQVLLNVFGGVVERSNEPESYLLNHNDALTEKEASHDATFIRDYEWAFKDAGTAIPIDLAAYYSIAREANGNTTLCHRGTGEVLLFAPDHSFDFVVPLEGCPDYTLYRISAARTFREWVEMIAVQWRA